MGRSTMHRSVMLAQRIILVHSSQKKKLAFLRSSCHWQNYRRGHFCIELPKHDGSRKKGSLAGRTTAQEKKEKTWYKTQRGPLPSSSTIGIGIGIVNVPHVFRKRSNVGWINFLPMNKLKNDRNKNAVQELV